MKSYISITSWNSVESNLITLRSVEYNPKLIFPQITSIRDGVAKLGWQALVVGWVVGQKGCIIEWLVSVYGYWAGPWGLLTFSIACQYC